MTIIHGIVVDCADPSLVAGFWKEALAFEYRAQEEDWVSLRNPEGGPHLSFDKVPEGKVVKNRVHLDIRPVNRTREEERRRLEALGARMLRLIDEDPNDVHYIMADPEDNEFCILEPHVR